MHNRNVKNFRKNDVVGQQAKDFKGAIVRLLKELKKHIFLVVISLVLAVFSAALSIYSPDKLADLTDEISKGLVINEKNLDTFFNKTIDNFKSEDMSIRLMDILSVDLSHNTVVSIMDDSSISSEDIAQFQEIINKFNNATEKEDLFKYIGSIPDSILNVILKESVYDGYSISVDDKIKFLKAVGTNNFSNIPEIFSNILFKEIEIDGVKVSSSDQYKFLVIMSKFDSEKDSSNFYSLIDKLPDSIIKVIEPSMDLSSIKKIAIFLIVIYICSAVFSYIQSICMTDVSNNFARDLRGKISTKINKLPLKYFDKHSTGDILSRVTNDVDTIAQTMNNSLASLVTSITLFLGCIIMMFCTNWIMALTAIVSSVIGFLGMSMILKNSQKYFVARQTELGNLNGHIEEIYSGLNVVKAYNGKRDALEKFDILNMNVCESNRKSQFLSGLMQPLMHFIGNFGYVAVCVAGALLVSFDKISFGVIVAFISYVRLFVTPLSQIAQSMTSLQSTAAASERVFNFLDEEEMSNEINIVKKLNKEKVKGNIEFNNVGFKYDDSDKSVINNFTAKVKAGQKIAIVGPTGAGKTTIVNLLMKFYDINSGVIKIDGISINDLSRENIHSLFTMVLQDTWLFEGTIRENIVYNRDEVSDDKITEVCKKVGLDHFIKTLPHGYDSLISDNDSVSAGQRQLLTIARGMIDDAPFLILDEATSNVDTRTEELVQIAMDKLMEGRTSFIIAHRLSTIKNADLILVMNDGNIIEQGNHNELMKKNGFYADLYNSQFEL